MHSHIDDNKWNAHGGQFVHLRPVQKIIIGCVVLISTLAPSLCAAADARTAPPPPPPIHARAH